MKKIKQKIFRKYQDFYTSEDLRDPDIMRRINLTIDDFDAHGGIVNPRAPCLVTTIDPQYTKDAGQQKLSRKFRMKTDILQLREIMRKKFMIYSTQQRHLERQREDEHQDRIYKQISDFYEFAESSLQQMESEAFNDMHKANEHLKYLQEFKVAEQLKSITAEHQRVLMELQDVYRRFKFFIKLIGYFDDSTVLEDTKENGCGQNESKQSAVLIPAEITELQISDTNDLGEKQVEQLKVYMSEVVRPYLAKRNHLNANIWIKGYEQTRQKIANYNHRFTRLALLNHIVTIVHLKFEKTHRTIKPMFLKDASFMQQRVKTLKERAHTIFENFERKHKKDKLNMKLNVIVPIVLESVEAALSKTHGEEDKEQEEEEQLQPQPQQRQKLKQSKVAPAKEKADAAASSVRDIEQGATLAKVEKIQAHLLELYNYMHKNLLSELDTMPPDLCKTIENRVRRKAYMEKEFSRRALIKQNRLKNWMAHFRKHEFERRKLMHSDKVTAAK